MSFNTVYKTLRTSQFYGLRDLISALPFFRFYLFPTVNASQLRSNKILLNHDMSITVAFLGTTYLDPVYFNNEVIFHFAFFYFTV